MSNERKHHTPEEKVTILRQHLVDKVPVSTLCDEHHVLVQREMESRRFR